MIFELLLASDRGGCAVRVGAGADGVGFVDLTVADLDGCVVRVGAGADGVGFVDLAVANLDGVAVDLECVGSKVVVLAVVDLELASLAVAVLASSRTPLAAATTGAGALAFSRGVVGLWS